MRAVSYKTGLSPRSSPYPRPGAMRIYSGFNRQSRSLHAPSSVMKSDPWMPAMAELQTDQSFQDAYPKDPWMSAIMAMDKVGQQFALRAPCYLYDATSRQSNGYSELLYHIPPELETQMWETYFALPPQPCAAISSVHIISIPDSPAADLTMCEDSDQAPLCAIALTPEHSSPPPPLPHKAAEPRPRRFSERIRAREHCLTTTRPTPYPSPQPGKPKASESSILVRKTRSRSLKTSSGYRSDTFSRRKSHSSSNKCSFDHEKDEPSKRHASGNQRRFQCVACADGLKYKTLRGLQQHLLHLTSQQDCLSSGLYAEFDFDDSQTWKVKAIPRAWTRAASSDSVL